MTKKTNFFQKIRAKVADVTRLIQGMAKARGGKSSALSELRIVLAFAVPTLGLGAVYAPLAGLQILCGCGIIGLLGYFIYTYDFFRRHDRDRLHSDTAFVQMKQLDYLNAKGEEPQPVLEAGMEIKLNSPKGDE